MNHFKFPYTNGFVEGRNDRIKVIKRVAYGYRNANNFRQRILLAGCRKNSKSREIDGLLSFEKGAIWS